MRFRGECGWSSSTAISASRRSRIGADRRSAMRCVSSVRALCRAAPVARRNTESAGARTCSSRSQARARASSEAVRSSRNASSSRNRASRSPTAASKAPRTQVLADALLMFGDRLLPAGVGVDCLGVGSQLQGGEPQDLAVDHGLFGVASPAPVIAGGTTCAGLEFAVRKRSRSTGWVPLPPSPSGSWNEATRLWTFLIIAKS